MTQKSRSKLPSRSAGFTIVELLVALILSLLIAIAAVASLTASRRGFATVDASAQLGDNARFAMDVIQRIAGQAGFKDLSFSTVEDPNLPATVFGFNNAGFSPADASAQTTVDWKGQSGSGSDVLILRYQAVRLNPDTESTTDFATDRSMIDCTGAALQIGSNHKTVPATTAVYTSVFYIANDVDGEPTLYCAAQDAPTPPAVSLPAFKSPMALIRGVESFQVLYGLQAQATSANAGTKLVSTKNSVPYTFMRADQLTVGSATSTDTLQNWKLVRSLRIGLVLRGAPNSQQERVSQRLYPFGKAKSGGGGTEGSAFVPSNATDDPGTQFDTPADGRFRQVVTFTVVLRNDQAL